MGAYALRRVIQAIVLLFVVSLVTFFLIHQAPGGPALLANPDLTQEQVAEMSSELQLDDPIIVQYGRWLGHALRGDLGNSYNAIEPVTAVIADRLPNTVILAAAAIAVSMLLGIPLGVISALKRNSALDRAVATFCFMGTSVPVFWLGIMLIVLFSVRLEIFPSGGMSTIDEDFSIQDRLEHLVLPMLVLAIGNLAELTRYTRSGMITILQEDFIRTARAKGLRESRVVIAHGLRNGLIPVVTVLGIMIPRAMGGAAITETVFSWPGIGRLAVESATSRDYPVVLGATLTVALLTIIFTLLTDLMYGVLDPRVQVD